MNTPLPVIRASSMKLAASCPASISGEGVQIDSFDPTATEGTDVHRAIALTLSGKMNDDNLPPMTSESEEMLGLALDWALHHPVTLAEYEVEKKLAFNPVAGTIDLVSRVASHGHIVDWKCTHREDDHEAQLISYAYLAFEEWAELETVDSYIVFLRREGILHKRYTRSWVYAWMDEFQHNTLSHPEIYRPGEWCGRCKRKWNCPALAQMNQSTAQMLWAPEFVGALARKQIPIVRTRVKLLKDAIDAFENFVREDVKINGPIDLGNGKELGALEINGDKIDLVKAWGTITGTFADSDLSKFITVKKTAMLDLIAEGVAKGKQKAKDEFMEKLRGLGAVTTEKSIQVRELNIRERK